MTIDQTMQANRTSAEAHEAMAAKLWTGADAFGLIVAAVEAMGDNEWAAIANEPDAADRIVIDGPTLIRDLRSLAMRLDRAVMIKCSKDD